MAPQNYSLPRDSPGLGIQEKEIYIKNTLVVRELGQWDVSPDILICEEHNLIQGMSKL